MYRASRMLAGYISDLPSALAAAADLRICASIRDSHVRDILALGVSVRRKPGSASISSSEASSSVRQSDRRCAVVSVSQVSRSCDRY